MKIYTVFYGDLVYGEDDESTLITKAPNGSYCYWVPKLLNIDSTFWYHKSSSNWREIELKDVPVKLKTLVLLMQ